MFDETQYDVHPIIRDAIPQSTEEASEVQAPIEEVQHEQPKQEAKQESMHEINYRALREKERRLEKERDEAVKMVQELHSRYAQQQKPTIPEEDDLPIGNDDIAEGKHLKEIYRELKRVRAEFNQHKQQATSHTAEARLKSQYPDFDKVVTRENVELLKESYPELAETLKSSPDLYNQGASAYMLIKKFCISEPHALEHEKAQKNILKPRPSNSISPQQGDSPLSRANAFANGLTEDLKTQLLKEMNDYRKDY